MSDPTPMNVNVDSFIYAVNQAYEARRGNDGSFKSHLRYEPFLSGTWDPSLVKNFENFHQILQKIIQHHFQILPNYRRKETVTLENLAWFSHSIAALFADMEFFISSCMGMSLPAFIGEKFPVNDGHQLLATLVNTRISLSFSDEQKSSPIEVTAVQLTVTEFATEEAQEIWALVSSLVKKTFSQYFHLFSLYASWKYSHRISLNQKSGHEESIDWNIRPPCGTAYRRQFKSLFEREDRSGGRASRSGKKEQPRLTQPQAPVVSPASNGALTETSLAPRVSGHKKMDDNLPNSNHLSFKPHSRKEALGGHKRSLHIDDKGSVSSEERRRQDLEDALKEAMLAVERLRQDPSLQEVSLQPQNSFIRREQHFFIAGTEFASESGGEERERHVLVCRKS